MIVLIFESQLRQVNEDFDKRIRACKRKVQFDGETAKNIYELELALIDKELFNLDWFLSLHQFREIRGPDYWECVLGLDELSRKRILKERIERYLKSK